MQIAFVPATLPALDGLDCDLLVVGCFLEDRPMLGVGGLLDWRLNGWISQLLEQERYQGELGELLLFPTGHRVGPRRVFLVGLGSEEYLDEARLSEVLEVIWATVLRLQSFDVALPLPGSHRSAIPKRRALSLLVAAARRYFEEETVGRSTCLTLLALPEDLRLLQSAMDYLDQRVL